MPTAASFFERPKKPAMTEEQRPLSESGRRLACVQERLQDRINVLAWRASCVSTSPSWNAKEQT